MKNAPNDLPQKKEPGMTEAPTRNRRSFKNYIIIPSFQLKYVFWITFTGMALLLLNGWIFYHYISENYSLLVELSPMTDEAKHQLFSELNQIIVRLLLFSLLFLLAVSAMGVVFSHKAAGPLFHFKKVFKAIKDGQIERRVRLRPTDEFQDVAQAFNEMMDTVTKKPKDRS